MNVTSQMLIDTGARERRVATGRRGDVERLIRAVVVEVVHGAMRSRAIPSRSHDTASLLKP